MNNDDVNRPDTPWVDRMEAHFVRAAQQRMDESEAEPEHAPRRWRSWKAIGPLLVAAAVLVVVAVAVSLGRDQTPAQALQITDAADGVLITVVDVVSDPDATLAQLKEAGITGASLNAVPVSPGLEGVIVSLLSDDGVEFESGTNSEGYPGVVSITVPSGYSAALEINYGRQALPGELYLASAAGPECRLVAGQRTADVLDVLNRLAPNIRWMHQDSTTFEIVETTEPNLDSYVVDYTPLDDSSMLVNTTDKLDESIPNSPYCIRD